ncbi:uncharacterized protein EI90DRAFT_3124353 [Cantharellus anzutake]|uniref:uncharacterized protein n=1 Tax=Cantharellus anzutake TaxID=1750568 RepID=UPI0019073F85|nr:uncharacterized protein EI90DRAFT_3124353 [Cantharellus anzutake]KAF8330315.1 hypothetical protein EI90DRAFT_3124353 [Cantharellus anzutake]
MLFGLNGSGTNTPLMREESTATVAMDDELEQATRSLVSLNLDIPGSWPKDKKARAARTRSIRAKAQRQMSFRKQHYNLRSATGKRNQPPLRRNSSRRDKGAPLSSPPSNTPPGPANASFRSPHHCPLNPRPSAPQNLPSPDVPPTPPATGPNSSLEELWTWKEHLRAEERDRRRKERQEAARVADLDYIKKTRRGLKEQERDLAARKAAFEEMKRAFRRQMDAEWETLQQAKRAQADADRKRREAEAEQARQRREREKRAQAEAEARAAREEARRRAEDQRRQNRRHQEQAQNGRPGTSPPIDPLQSQWDWYQRVWKAFLSSESYPEMGTLTYINVPWPVMPPANFRCTSPDDISVLLNEEAIAEFIFAPTILGDTVKRKRLQEVMLRFHPDKVSRWQRWIHPTHLEAVHTLCTITTKYLNNLKDMRVPTVNPTPLCIALTADDPLLELRAISTAPVSKLIQYNRVGNQTESKGKGHSSPAPSEQARRECLRTDNNAGSSPSDP